MKWQTKRIIPMVIGLILTIATLTSCDAPQKQNKNDLSLFIQPKAEIRYDGILDYQHTLKFLSEEDHNGDMLYRYKGEIIDLSDGEAKKEDLEFFENIYVTKDSLIEEVIGSSKYNYSIIDKKVALKLPLTKGNMWEEEVSYKGNKYTATTEIIDVLEDEEGKTVITKTVINDIKGFDNNTYKEIRVYKENEGLIYFSKPIENISDFYFSWWKEDTDLNKYIKYIEEQ